LKISPSARFSISFIAFYEKASERPAIFKNASIQFNNSYSAFFSCQDSYGTYWNEEDGCIRATQT